MSNSRSASDLSDQSKRDAVADKGKGQQPWVLATAISVAVVAFVVPYVWLTSDRRNHLNEVDGSSNTIITTTTHGADSRSPIEVTEVSNSLPNVADSAENAVPLVSNGAISVVGQPETENEKPQPKPKAAAKTPIPAEELFRRISPAVVQILNLNSQGRLVATGSGFLVDRSGLIVTNHHVINNAHSVWIVLAEKKRLAVEGALALDKNADIAILRVPFIFDAEPLEFAKEETPVGSKVYAIGNPRGFSNTMSDGLLSGTSREINGNRMIQTTAPISPGSSGGPLVTPNGDVIGVTTLSRKDSQNLNFAIPGTIVKDHLVRAKQEAKVVTFPINLRSNPPITQIDRGQVPPWTNGPPRPLYGHDLKVRRGGSRDWTLAIRMGVEVFMVQVGNVRAFLAITETGRISVSPLERIYSNKKGSSGKSALKSHPTKANSVS